MQRQIEPTNTLYSSMCAHWVLCFVFEGFELMVWFVSSLCQTMLVGGAHRHRTTELPEEMLRDTDVVLPEFANLVEDDDADDDDDVQQQISALKKARAKQLLHQGRMRELAVAAAKSMARANAASASGASSAQQAPPAGRPRRFVPMPPESPTQEEAQALLPPPYRISKDDRRENRFRLRGPGVGGEKSKSFGRNSGRTPRDAFGLLFVMAWRAHERLTGERCPYELEGV